ncbi:MAG: hypothetical protein LLF96_11820 [Eubacteriales bacterium]|nr:hypothetical protein [Eubacteriales bacterium]
MMVRSPYSAIRVYAASFYAKDTLMTPGSIFIPLLEIVRLLGLLVMTAVFTTLLKTAITHLHNDAKAERRNTFTLHGDAPLLQMLEAEMGAALVEQNPATRVPMYWDIQ